ncbi:MAG: aldehyde dehydrogenase family protein [Gammaproteobacteria bacterium]|nr:aldehyde dehydrogenase family protein [Gammaproteobacteria bacterium]
MLAQINQHYIGGAWQASAGSNTLILENPVNGEEYLEIILADERLVDQAVAAAKQAQILWGETSTAQRAEYITKIADELEARREQLIDALSLELGCPKWFVTEVQVDDPIDALRKHVRWTLDLTNTDKHDERLEVLKEPIGVSAIITPWNYPLHQLIAKIAPALAAGCTLVVKPSEYTPKTAIILAQAIEASGLPAGVFNLVVGTGADIGDALTTHPDVRCVSFTGSTKVGVHIQQQAAQSVKRVLLELGGKSAFLIDKTNNLQQAVELGVEDVLVNSGQTCVALTRMLVHESQYQQACEIAKQYAESAAISADLSSDALLGPVINRTQFERVLAYIELGQSEGASLLCGGKSTLAEQTKGFFIGPTIFANVDNSMRIAQEEIFGPVLCLIPYQDTEHAIAIANDTPFGLSARVWADDKSKAKDIAKQIEAGQVYINDAMWHNAAPFGGYKQSGNGRELGSQAINEFLESKSVIF